MRPPKTNHNTERLKKKVIREKKASIQEENYEKRICWTNFRADIKSVCELKLHLPNCF